MLAPNAIEYIIHLKKANLHSQLVSLNYTTDAVSSAIE